MNDRTTNQLPRVTEEPRYTVPVWSRVFAEAETLTRGWKDGRERIEILIVRAFSGIALHLGIAGLTIYKAHAGCIKRFVMQHSSAPDGKWDEIFDKTISLPINRNSISGFFAQGLEHLVEHGSYEIRQLTPSTWTMHVPKVKLLPEDMRSQQNPESDSNIADSMFLVRQNNTDQDCWIMQAVREQGQAGKFMPVEQDNLITFASTLFLICDAHEKYAQMVKLIQDQTAFQENWAKRTKPITKNLEGKNI